MTNRARKNIFVLDLVRALCIIWIVVVWHGNSYMPFEYHYSESALYLDHVTTVVLALFSSLSGLLLSKYRFTSLSEVKFFYKKRFSRFYVLFFIAVLLFYLLGFYSFKTSVKCILGLSVYIGQMPYTLWYISMLMTFYILTPLMRYACPKRYIGVTSAMVFIFVLVMFHYVGKVDFRIVLYFVCYSMGLYAGDNMLEWLRKHDWNAPSKIYKGVEVVAYASYCMYLYHRVIFYLTGRFFSYAERGSMYFCMPIWCNIVAIVLTILLSYYTQMIYNNVTSFRNNRHTKIS